MHPRSEHRNRKTHFVTGSMTRAVRVVFYDVVLPRTCPLTSPARDFRCPLIRRLTSFPLLSKKKPVSRAAHRVRPANKLRWRGTRSTRKVSGTLSPTPRRIHHAAASIQPCLTCGLPFVVFFIHNVLSFASLFSSSPPPPFFFSTREHGGRKPTVAHGRRPLRTASGRPRSR